VYQGYTGHRHVHSFSQALAQSRDAGADALKRRKARKRQRWPQARRYVSQGGGGAWMGARRAARGAATQGWARRAGKWAFPGMPMATAGGASLRQSDSIHAQTTHMCSLRSAGSAHAAGQYSVCFNASARRAARSEGRRLFKRLPRCMHEARWHRPACAGGKPRKMSAGLNSREINHLHSTCAGETHYRGQTKPSPGGPPCRGGRRVERPALG
jgi:hypothetical protein